MSICSLLIVIHTAHFNDHTDWDTCNSWVFFVLSFARYRCPLQSSCYWFYSHCSNKEVEVTPHQSISSSHHFFLSFCFSVFLFFFLMSSFNGRDWAFGFIHIMLHAQHDLQITKTWSDVLYHLCKFLPAVTLAPRVWRWLFFFYGQVVYFLKSQELGLKTYVEDFYCLVLLGGLLDALTVCYFLDSMWTVWKPSIS